MAEDPPYYYMRPGHVLAAAIAFIIVDIAVVGLRFGARRVQRQSLGADDWLMIPATLITIGIAVSQIYGVSQKAIGYRTQIPPGFTGRPSELSTPQLTLKSQLEWSFFLVFPIATGCMKASFLYFYKRVFAIQKHSALNKSLTAFIILIAAWTTAFFFATLFECGRNFSAIWSSQRNFSTQCFNNINLILTLCITDFIADLVIICIPIPLVLRLKLSPSKKIAVCSLFLLGSATVVASIVRFVLMAGSFLGNINITDDSILGTTACLYWGTIECGVGVLAACLPTTQFLFKRWVWEPAVGTTKSIFTSQATTSSRASWFSGSQKDAIHVDQTIDVAYARVYDDPGQFASSADLRGGGNERFARESYHMWDQHIGTAVSR